jgi:hypothetical protein
MCAAPWLLCMWLRQRFTFSEYGLFGSVKVKSTALLWLLHTRT